MPISVIPLKKSINKPTYFGEKRDPKQSTDFSLHASLVPKHDYKMGIHDCDMLCQDDLANLWDQRNNEYSVLCVNINSYQK